VYSASYETEYQRILGTPGYLGR